jgi:hypothetical protein
MSTTQVCQMVYFQTKILNLGNLNMLVGIFNGYLEYFPAIRYILWLNGNVVEIWSIFPRFLVYCVKKNLATLQLLTRLEKLLKPNFTVQTNSET